MEIVNPKGMKKKKKKKNLFMTTWGRCKSCSAARMMVSMGKSLRNTKRRQGVAPEGCFSVYVGPQRQRFVMKAEYANHHLFRMLLEESEFGYENYNQGPITLPCCDVDLFSEVLAEMECDDHGGCSFPMGNCSPLMTRCSPACRRQN